MSRDQITEHRRGYYDVTELGIAFDRAPSSIRVDAKSGKLGSPILIGRWKFFSLQLAELFYQRAVPLDKLRLIKRRREYHDRLARLATLIRALRDAEWADAIDAAATGRPFTDPTMRVTLEAAFPGAIQPTEKTHGP